MELTDKYKKTILGYIPIDWSISSLLKVVENQKALFDDGDWVEAEHITESGVRLIQTGNIGIGEFKEKQSRKYIYEKSFYSLKCKPLTPGDLLICRLAEPAGRACIFPVLPDEKVITSVDVTICRPSPMIVNRDFLAHYFSTSSWFRNVSMNVGGTTHKRISRSALGRIPIVLPPIDEQRSIAQALNNISTLINQFEKLIEKKSLVRQGIIQVLLNPLDKNGNLKEGWTAQTVFNLAENKKELFDDGDWIEAEHITTQGIRLIQTGNIGVGRFLDKNIKKYIYESSFKKLRCKELIAGDLLICRLAEPAGRACIFPILEDEKVITSVDVTIFRPRSDIANRVFLVNLFSTPEWFNAVNESVGGTTHKRISRGALGKIVLQLPPIEEQNETASILSDMSLEILALEKKLEKTRKIKQGMMQSLLTGQIRLVDPTPKNEQ